jgi:hypothetical protein
LFGQVALVDLSVVELSVVELMDYPISSLEMATNSVVLCMYSGIILPEAGFLVRSHPDPCPILIRAQIHALLCASKFIPA